MAAKRAKDKKKMEEKLGIKEVIKEDDIELEEKLPVKEEKEDEEGLDLGCDRSEVTEEEEA